MITDYFKNKADKIIDIPLDGINNLFLVSLIINLITEVAFSAALMIAWNIIIPPVFGIATITFIQALGIRFIKMLIVK